MREKRQTSLGGPRAQISGWKNRAPKLDQSQIIPLNPGWKSEHLNSTNSSSSPSGPWSNPLAVIVVAYKSQLTTDCPQNPWAPCDPVKVIIYNPRRMSENVLV